MRRAATSVCVALIAAACGASGGGPSPKANTQTKAEAKSPVKPAKPVFVAAGPGDAAEVVRAAVTAAGADTTVLVYVGAEWCEPCQYFHKAVEAGKLDNALAGVKFVEFDSDLDRDRLAAGSYDGRLIPRFVRPAADGSGSDTRIEGGIKGEGAVQHIMQRLTPMLAAR